MWRKLQIYLVLFDEDWKAVPKTREVDKGRAALYIYIFCCSLLVMFVCDCVTTFDRERK